MKTINIIVATILCTFLLSEASSAQEVINFILIGDNGITKDVKRAHSFVMVRRLPGNKYERLDYKMHAPLLKLKTYSDSALQHLDGPSMEYHPSGFIRLKGNYVNGLKEGDWYSYNDTGKIILKGIYTNGKLIKMENPDTVKVREMHGFDTEQLARPKGNDNAWRNYLIKHSYDEEVIEKSLKGGEVKVGFMVDTTGKLTEVYLFKSVEYILDDELIKLIKAAPLWEPAFQNGKPVNAYRIQGMTFVKD